MRSRLGRLVDSSLAVYRARSVCRTLLWGRAGDSCDRSSPGLAVQWRTDGGRSALAQGRSALRLAALAGRRVPAVHRALSGRGGSGECHGPGVSGSEGAADCSLQRKPHENTAHETEGVRRPAVTDRQPGQARGAGARGRGPGGGTAPRALGPVRAAAGHGPGGSAGWAPLLRDLRLAFSPAKF